MTMFIFKAVVSLLTMDVIGAMAETHEVDFANKCGFGKPTLVQGGRILSTGEAFTSSGPLIGAIAYLQTGSCGFNGEGCTLIELTLRNPTSNLGSGSIADISLIPPHAFSVASGFGYFKGCEGAGVDCTTADCPTAFHQTSDTNVQVTCQANDVNFAILFCD